MNDPDTLPPPSEVPRSWKERLLIDGPPLLYIFGVFFACSIPIVPSVGVPLLSIDKVQHALAFFGMQLLVHRALLHERVFATERMNLVVAGVGCTAFGGFIELWQTALPYRSGDWADLLADALGVLLGTGLIVALGRHRFPAQKAHESSG
ncbi:MAG: VanZ family protein [Polyangiaceae bacterium]|nr:VanZ family protein [Polyangiaceae bacterium]